MPRARSPRSPRLRRQVEHHELARGVSISAFASSGTSKCGITLENHEPGPSTDQVGVDDRVDRLGTAGGSAGTRVTDAPGRAWSPPRPARDGALRRRVAWIEPGHLGHDVQRHHGHRQHPAVGAHSRPARSRAATWSPSNSLSADEQVADAWSFSSPALSNRCWTTRPRCDPTGHRRKRRQCLPEVAGRQGRIRRSRPLEPPSSATVTTAVRCRSPRSAESDAAGPCRLRGRPPRSTRDRQAAAPTRQGASLTATGARRSRPANPTLRRSAFCTRGHSRPRSRWVT